MIEVNDHFAFLTDKVYPLMPGDMSYRLHDANKHGSLHLSAGALTTVKLRSVQVNLNCGPWEWECLGKRDVNLYEKDAPYPFIESSTDIPIMFAYETDIQVELEGSRGLRQLIQAHVRTSIFETAELHLVPEPSVRPAQLSYLVRLEPESPQLAGFSHDIPYTKTTSLPLMVGTYSLHHYFLLGHNFATTPRGSNKTKLTLQKGDSRTLSFDYFLPEHKGMASVPTSKPLAKPKEGQPDAKIF